MRILLLGDIVGRAGREAVAERMPAIRERLALDFVVANGENAAGGFGITERILSELTRSGVDVVTTGNHVWDQKETAAFIDRAPRLLRPVNFPKDTPGRGHALYEAPRGRKVLVANLMGRLFMDPLDDPFAAGEAILAETGLGRGADAVLFDFHAEATSEKMAFGHAFDGRVSAVVGTHTHVPTADAMLLEKGTAYLTDAGMCGDYDSVIGMQKEEPLRRFTTGIPSARFEPAAGVATLSGVAVETDNSSGLALRVAPVRAGGRLEPAVPTFWV
jgi:metallophosphoesterase (TIGR00282 family)